MAVESELLFREVVSAAYLAVGVVQLVVEGELGEKTEVKGDSERKRE